MDFGFSQDQEELREHLRSLLADVCPPEYAEACDRDGKPPREAYNALAEQGWLGIIVPKEFGGSERNAIDLAILLEEAGRHFEELGVWLFRTITYGGYAVMAHGTKEQKEYFLPKVAKGELSFCFGLTEPESGSDAAALKTRARPDSNENYTINGQKVFTSGMDISDYCLLVARTSDGEKKQQGITNFLVDTSLDG
ncbi:MAG: acyl-CoA dehydrogenase family protein, partial [Methyloligellaceae bacterium]